MTKVVESYKNTAAQKNRSTLKQSDPKFYDPIKIKNQNPEDKPKNGVKSPWDFRCPQYDQRSSNFVNAGTHYGVGHRQPIGHLEPPKELVPCLPKNIVQTMQIDDLG
jgi:hypothetical protein